MKVRISGNNSIPYFYMERDSKSYLMMLNAIYEIELKNGNYILVSGSSLDIKKDVKWEVNQNVNQFNFEIKGSGTNRFKSLKFDSNLSPKNNDSSCNSNAFDNCQRTCNLTCNFLGEDCQKGCTAFSTNNYTEYTNCAK